MPGDSAEDLRARLKRFGLADAAITAAWPAWWSEDADASASARAELRFGVARRLGMDPRSLLEEQEAPRFLWREEARFKHLTTEEDVERAGIISFGRSVAVALLSAADEAVIDLAGVSAAALRQSVLDSGRPYVGLADLLALCWGIGVPVAHLRVFPWQQKRMAAMTVGVGERWSVLVGKDASYPAPIAFYVAHELGHIALSHIAPGRALVDLDVESLGPDEDDEEERAADEFALELLTGRPQPVVVSETAGAHAAPSELARVALAAADELQIEPGTLALCFGYSTQDWATANGSLKRIYEAASPVWRDINGIAATQLEMGDVPIDVSDFLLRVMGLAADG